MLEQPYKADDFAAFEMPSKKMPDSEITRYRVYLNPKDFKIVIADNAAEAMVEANIGIPYKVVREMPLYESLISPRLIGLGVKGTKPDDAQSSGEIPLNTLLPSDGDSPPAATPTAPAVEMIAPPAEENIVQEVGAAVSDAASATLSQDEINKLLEG